MPGQHEDDGSERDTDEDRQRCRDARVELQEQELRAVEGLDRVRDSHEVGELGRQVDVGGNCREDGRDCRRSVEAAVDGHQAVLARAGPGDVDAKNRGQCADGRDDQGEDQALFTEGDLAQDECGDQRHGIRLEEVGCHAGAVTDVVAHVVRDRRRIARVVLGDACLDLADQVGADVSGLGEDAAANTHEHGEQCSTEPEALENLGGIALVDEHHRSGTQQAQAHGHHADGATGAEGDAHALIPARAVRG